LAGENVAVQGSSLTIPAMGGFRLAQASSATQPVKLYAGPPAEPVVFAH
jgi:hypothetical protein